MTPNKAGVGGGEAAARFRASAPPPAQTNGDGLLSSSNRGGHYRLDKLDAYIGYLKGRSTADCGVSS